MSARSAKIKKNIKSPVKQIATTEDEKFFDIMLKATEEIFPDFTKSINIALIGKVSSGKSSLMNALLRRTRENPAVAVGATSGITTKMQPFRLHERFLIVDSPGLSDIVSENSDETLDFLKHVDLGLLVVSGSADASQKKHYDDLQRYAKKVVVALNKIDEWDDLDESELQAVVEQWKEKLGTDIVYPVCTKGFDPKTKPGTAMDLRGIDEVRKVIEDFFQEEGKDHIFAHAMGDRTPAVVACIAGTTLIVAGQSFLPGSAIYITATQAVAIAKLYYIYKGKAIDPASILSLLPLFLADSGKSLFLWGKTALEAATFGASSIISVAIGALGAGIAASLTLATLNTVNFVFKSGFDLNQTEMLRKEFALSKKRADALVKATGKTDVSQLRNKGFWLKTVASFLS